MYGRFFHDLYTVCSVSSMPLRTVTPANWCMVFNAALHRTYMILVLRSDMIEPNSVQSSGGQLWYQPEQSWNSISIQNAIMPCENVLFRVSFFDLHLNFTEDRKLLPQISKNRLQRYYWVNDCHAEGELFQIFPLPQIFRKANDAY